jgi:copper chaperone
MELNLKVDGMTCGHCEQAVKNAVLEIDAAASIQIDRSKGSVKVETEGNKDDIVKAIEEEGYAVLSIL